MLPAKLRHQHALLNISKLQNFLLLSAIFHATMASRIYLDHWKLITISACATENGLNKQTRNPLD